MNNQRYTEPNGLPHGCLVLIDRLRASYGFAYRLHWKGSKIPRGAAIRINGVDDPIGWTQHGQVYGSTHGVTGHYERTQEWSGPDRDEHEMIIATDGEVIPAEGMTSELIRDFALTV